MEKNIRPDILSKYCQGHNLRKNIDQNIAILKIQITNYYKKYNDKNKF